MGSFQIKFRAWHKNKEKMLEVLSISFTLRTMWAKPFGDEEGHINEELVLFDDVVLMQSTGLKDKNGVEVYEGDLINMHYRNLSVEKGEVVSVEMGMTYDSDGLVNEKTYGWLAGKNSLADVAPYAEVLGNAYENPELLGDANE